MNAREYLEHLIHRIEQRSDRVLTEPAKEFLRERYADLARMIADYPDLFEGKNVVARNLHETINCMADMAVLHHGPGPTIDEEDVKFGSRSADGGCFLCG